MLDDDSEWLEMFGDFLTQLPSKPDICMASSGMRALSLLDAEPFRVLLCDLKMPQMAGLEVLSIVRRRFPELRTVALTGVSDEEFRSLAYAMGVDLFWQKLDTQQNPQLFLDCIESLLIRDDDGSRDVQRKNLLDVIRMESALRNSSVLRITSWSKEAHIWIKDGQMIDAKVEGADGEAAFWRIMKWEDSAFESLPPEPGHTQTIAKSLESLLLESVQTVKKADNPTPRQAAAEAKLVTQLTAMAYEGADFVVTVPAKNEDAAKGWGIKDVDQLSAWVRQAGQAARRLGRKLNAGPWTHAAGHNLERHLLLLPENGKTFVAGWPPEADTRRLFEQSKKLADTWAS
ncbi:MAG: response regulator [Verrucomicrobiota bacterium]